MFWYALTVEFTCAILMFVWCYLFMQKNALGMCLYILCFHIMCPCIVAKDVITDYARFAIRHYWLVELLPNCGTYGMHLTMCMYYYVLSVHYLSVNVVMNTGKILHCIWICVLRTVLVV